MPSKYSLTLSSNDLAIDLGTTNTSVYVQGKGIVLHEPSVIAISRNGGRDPKVLAVGNAAKQMIGRTPQKISALRPIRDGVIADFEIVGSMLRGLIALIDRRRGLVKPRVVMSIPTGITPVEKRAVRETALSAGAREVHLIEESLAAAMGAGLPFIEPTGSMIVDIGGGRTEVSVISLGGIVLSRSIRVGGDKMDEAILQYIKRKYNFLIGSSAAEAIKLAIGNAHPSTSPQSFEIRGRDLVSGIPSTLTIDSSDVRDALSEEIGAIVEMVRVTLERTPPELSADLIERGIVLTGGGALLKHLNLLLEEATGLPVILASDPFSTVILGCGKVLDDLDILRRIGYKPALASA